MQSHSPALRLSLLSWVSLVAQLVRIHLQCGRPGSIPGLGRSPGEGKDYPLQYSGPENSMDYRPWSLKELDTTEQRSLSLSRASLVVQSVKNLSAMQETWVQSLGQEDPLEKGTAPHSRILAWRILWIEEPGGLQFIGSQRVGCD